MSTARIVSQRLVSLAISMALVSLGLVVLASPTAQAADPPGPAPIEQRSQSMATNDPLPTVQIDSGVVWSQMIVGNKVFAGGSFSNARPAGAAAGTNLTPRANLLAYNITTGSLDTTFAPVLNGQVRVVTKSPDNSTIYVGGDFTSVNGQARFKVASFNATTGALLPWKPAVGGSYVTAIAVTLTNTVYVGGLIQTGNGVARQNLVAFNSAGTLLNWAPVTDLQVDALVLTPGDTKLIVGGRFSKVNNVSQRGLAALSLVDGSNIPWAATQQVVNGYNTAPYAGKAGIWSLRTDGKAIYGTGWVYAIASVGNLEGTFSADPETGNLNWVEDCHGDTYDSYSDGTTVYALTHAHYCGAVGGFPQSDPWATNTRHALAFTTAAKGTLAHDAYAGGTYQDWYGTPSPAMINWFPDFLTGKATGQGQAAWTVTGNGNYVVMGGEFPFVNNVAQYGLVRFAKKGVAPLSQAKDGPRLRTTGWLPNLISVSAGTVRVAFSSNWDRDDLNLTYKVIRDGNTAIPVYTATAASTFWNRPVISFNDTGLAPGSTHSYKLTATDSDGNVATGNPVSVTVTDSAASAYAQKVLDDGAGTYWRLGEPSGSTVFDWAGFNDGVASSGVTRSVVGAIQGDANTASHFDGSNAGIAVSSADFEGPQVFTASAWFRTTSTTGGKILGFGNAVSGDSGNYDRHIYMENGGQIRFGVYPGATKTVRSTDTYNDGKWHQVVGTLGSGGMALFIDGVQIGADATVTNAQAYQGRWRVGGDNVNGWPGSPSSFYFQGDVDEVAIYSRVLGAAEVQQQFSIGEGSFHQSPVAIVGAQSAGLTVAFDGTGSTASDGATLSSYSWDFGDGSTSTQASPTHKYLVAGTFTAKLTVTDSQGAVSTQASKSVVTTHAAPTAVIGSSATALTVAFDGTASTTSDGATISTYAWEFGDGGTSSQPGPSHSYNAAGTYVAKLTITDSVGGVSAQATKSITVAAAHQKPVAVIGSVPVGLTVAYDGTGSTTSDGATIAAYTWDFGDGGTSTEAQPAHPYAASGSYTAKLTVTDSQGASSVQASKTVAVTHKAPVAAFDASTDTLTATFDSAASSAFDQATITGFGWDFGDGSTSTQANPVHPYTAGGTYVAKLTVTDSLGATSTQVTKSVTVAQAHVAPVAVISSVPSELSVAFDGTGSTTSDNATIATYAWTFGDGATSTQATPSHTYAAAGTFLAKLTVTDSLGATSTPATKSITVIAPAGTVVATDTFSRTVASGWGSANTGGAWNTAAGFTVAAGVGQIALTRAGQTRANLLTAVSARNVDATLDIAIDKAADGNGQSLNYRLRQSATGDYRAKLRWFSNGQVTVSLAKYVGTTETVLATKVVSGAVYVPGDSLRVHVQVSGTGTTALKVNVWPTTQAEPSGWQLSASDNTAPLQAAGAVGIEAYLSGNATNAPVTATLDNVNVVSLP